MGLAPLRPRCSGAGLRAEHAMALMPTRAAACRGVPAMPVCPYRIRRRRCGESPGRDRIEWGRNLGPGTRRTGCGIDSGPPGTGERTEASLAFTSDTAGRTPRAGWSTNRCRAVVHVAVRTERSADGDRVVEARASADGRRCSGAVRGKVGVLVSRPEDQRPVPQAAVSTGRARFGDRNRRAAVNLPMPSIGSQPWTVRDGASVPISMIGWSVAVRGCGQRPITAIGS